MMTSEEIKWFEKRPPLCRCNTYMMLIPTESKYWCGTCKITVNLKAAKFKLGGTPSNSRIGKQIELTKLWQ